MTVAQMKSALTKMNIASGEVSYSGLGGNAKSPPPAPHHKNNSSQLSFLTQQEALHKNNSFLFQTEQKHPAHHNFLASPNIESSKAINFLTIEKSQLPSALVNSHRGGARQHGGKLETVPSSPTTLKEKYNISKLSKNRFVRESPHIRNEDLAATTLHIDKKTIDLPPLK